MHTYGKVRKYPEDCLKLGFSWSGDEENPNPFVHFVFPYDGK
jgi:hypothetical protein